MWIKWWAWGTREEANSVGIQNKTQPMSLQELLITDLLKSSSIVHKPGLGPVQKRTKNPIFTQLICTLLHFSLVCYIRTFPMLYILFLLPTWAWKPVLMEVTDLVDPHALQLKKCNLFADSLFNSVFMDLHVLQVTYSMI